MLRTSPPQSPSFALPRAGRLVLSVLALGFAGLASCSSGGSDIAAEPGDGRTVATTRVDLLLRDAPIDDLAAFRATLESVRLERVTGGSTDRLVTTPVELEFLGLRDRACFAASFELEEGAYAALRLRFAPGSPRAFDLGGREVEVRGGELFVVPLDQALELEGEPYVRLEVDLDLRASLSGDVAAGSIDFDPTGSVLATNGSVPVRVEGMDGLVTARDLTDGSLVVDAMVGDGRTAPLRELRVRTDPATLLVGYDVREAFDVAPFLANLSPGASVVEIDGWLGAGGALQAARVELEDQNGLSGNRFAVELEALVIGRLGPTVLEVVVRETTRGGDLVELLLAGQPEPVLRVVLDPITLLTTSEGVGREAADIELGDALELKLFALGGALLQPRRAVVTRVASLSAVRRAATDVSGADVSGTGAWQTDALDVRLDVAHRPQLSGATREAALERSPGLVATTSTAPDVVLVRPVRASAGGVLDAVHDPAGRLRGLRVASLEIRAGFGGHGAFVEGAVGPAALELVDALRVHGDAASRAELEALLSEGEVVLELAGLPGAEAFSLEVWEVGVRRATPEGR